MRGASTPITCPFTGQWSGTYGGAGSGTWSVVVDTGCNVTGSHSGSSPGGPVSGGISGVIEVDGTLALKAAFGSATCPWEGTATQTTASGTWSCGGGISGTWSGSRKGP